MQGDVVSPTLFKLVINLLLLKLHLDDNIKIPHDIHFNYNFHIDPPSNNSAFADDCIIFMEVLLDALDTCNDILKSFFEVSGLKVNAQKTKLCLVGDQSNALFKRHGERLGFQFVDSFRLLGVNFDNKLRHMDKNIDSCIEKMNRIRNFWGLFNLTIPGKINVIKCFLMSQINYIGSFLTFKEQHFEKIDQIICSFLCENQLIAKSKIFSRPEEGGLGLTRTKNLLKSLDVLLVKKSMYNNDTWAKDLFSYASLDDKLNFVMDINKSIKTTNHLGKVYQMTHL